MILYKMVILDAANYVKKNLQKGLSEEEVKRKLLDFGFSEFQASEAIQKAKSDIDDGGNFLKSKDKKKTLIIILIAIFIIILVFCIVIYLIVSIKANIKNTDSNISGNGSVSSLGPVSFVWITALFKPHSFAVIQIENCK